MIRLELFILLGIVIGVVATLAVQWVWGKISAAREERIIARAKAEARKVRIDEAATDELLDEISTRNDLQRTSWDMRATEWKIRMPKGEE